MSDTADTTSDGYEIVEERTMEIFVIDHNECYTISKKNKPPSYSTDIPQIRKLEKSLIILLLILFLVLAASIAVAATVYNESIKVRSQLNSLSTGRNATIPKQQHTKYI